MKMTAVSSACVLVMMFSLCCQPAQPPLGPAELAPILHGSATVHPAFRAASEPPPEPLRVASRSVEAAKPGPVINIEGRFLAGPVRRLKQLGLVPDTDVAIVSAAEINRRCERARAEADVRILTAPRMTIYPGQRAWVAVETQQAYLRDIEYVPEPRPGQPTLTPVIGVVRTGTVLDVSARLDGEKVIFTSIKPATTAVLGWRECSAKVAVGGRCRTEDWREPVVLVATVELAEPCDISLGPDERLLVRLGYRVVQPPPASARLMAANGKVRERYVPQYESALVPGAAPAHIQHVLVLSARKIEAKPSSP